MQTYEWCVYGFVAGVCALSFREHLEKWGVSHVSSYWEMSQIANLNERRLQEQKLQETQPRALLQRYCELQRQARSQQGLQREHGQLQLQ